MQNERLYKNKYGIGIYRKIRKTGDTDELVALVDNAKQFARFIGKSIKVATDILGNKFNKRQDSSIRLNNREYEIAFIDMLED